MRLREVRALSVACLLAVAPRPAAAVPAPDAEAPRSNTGRAATAKARRHFKLGLKLYRDANYAGALAEFEAAYAAKPGRDSLQDVALCQKALFRYREAAITLAELLRAHGTELSEGEAKAVSEAIEQLRGLVGSIVVDVEPSEAKVSIDGRALSLSELRAGVDLNVGEHTLVADLPGYARQSRVVRVASGRKPAHIELKLEATDGFLNVIASDPRAAIAIDGTTRAFHEWRGGVKPNAQHLIQVFREGYEGFETRVSVALGKTLEVRAALGPRLNGEAAETAVEKAGRMPTPPPAHVPRGYYGLLTLRILGLGEHPLAPAGTRSGDPMGTIGLRAGYRLWAPVALEFVIDYGKLAVRDVQSDDSSGPRGYSLNALRLGPNLRLMTTGKTVRFSSTVGAGAVHHRLALDAVAANPTLTGESASGVDPYFLLEFGVQCSLAHFLLGAEVVALLDGATSLNRQSIEGASKAFGDTNTLPLFGLGIHGGYSLW